MADGGNAADFTLRLHNQVTGPARTMRRSIQGLNSELKDQQKFFAKGENEFQKKLKESRRFTDSANRDAIRGMRQRRAATERMAAAAKRLQDRQSERRDVGFQRRAIRQRESERQARQQAMRAEGLEPGIGVVSTGGALAIAGALAAAAAAASFLAAKMVSATVAAVDFGQSSRTALASILKDGPLAAQQFAEVRAESQKLGLDVTDTVGEFKMLANSGFQVPMARELVRMSADLQALTGSSESAAFALKAISQIKMKGRLQAEEITGQLAEHGVSADEVYKVLGKTLGKTREEILKMQKAGNLSADVAIPAILQAVRNQLGVEQSGGFALKMNTSSIGGMFRTLKAQVQNAFISLGDRVGPGITRAFQSIMAQIQAAVASPQMQAFGNAIVSLFDTISSLVGQTDFASLLVSAATALGTELTAAAVYIRDHGAELRDSFIRFVQAMGTGLQMAADFFKPFIEFANSDFAKFMFTPLDEQGRNTASQIDDLAIRKGFAPANARGGAIGAAAAAAGASGTRVDAKFGDFNINLNGSAATPEGGLRSAVDQTRREMMAMLQDL